MNTALDNLKHRLRCARSRFNYHNRIGHGASRTRLPAGEAKALARADIEHLQIQIEAIKAKVNGWKP